MQTAYWPFFGLRITTARLELRYPDDELVVALAELAAGGVHDPSTMPFTVPWTDSLGYEANGTDWAAPRGERRQMVRYRMTEETWRLRTTHDHVAVHGIEPCRELLGLSDR